MTPAGSSLELVRRWFTPQSTVGELTFDGFTCYVLEPPKRAQKPCCIPPGRYEIRLTHSEKFGVPMPIICEVPGFEGVRIHVGNYPKDTLACWLPGNSRQENFVGGSAITYEALFEKIKRAPGPIYVTVREEPE